MRRNLDDPCRCPGECPYLCPVHGRHHVVPSMVDWCIEKATAPGPGVRTLVEIRGDGPGPAGILGRSVWSA